MKQVTAGRDYLLYFPYLLYVLPTGVWHKVFLTVDPGARHLLQKWLGPRRHSPKMGRPKCQAINLASPKRIRARVRDVPLRLEGGVRQRDMIARLPRHLHRGALTLRNIAAKGSWDIFTSSQYCPIYSWGIGNTDSLFYDDNRYAMRVICIWNIE